MEQRSAPGVAPPSTGEPKLSATHKEFPCGYGPRSIRLSLDRQALFVGCKDGSVTSIELAAADKDGDAVRRLCPAGAAGVGSLCDLGNGWLLLGQDGGRLRLLRWQGQAAVPYDAGLDLGPDAGPIGYVGRWDPGIFVASPRYAEAVRFRLVPSAASSAALPVLVRDAKLPGVLAMCDFVRTGEQERWLVCKTGALWRCGLGKPELRSDVWDVHDLERPGFVYDLAVVRRDPEDDVDVGAYLTTDQGVFLIRPPTVPTDERPLAIDPVHLPGTTGMLLAVTHAVQHNRCYLWVSDAEGSVHLYWSRRDRMEKRPPWHRSGLREGSFPAMRAVASWTPGREHEAIVGQACRNDRVVVSWYRTEQRTADVDPDDAEVLSWDTVESVRGLAGDPRRYDAPDALEWTVEALVADWIEWTGRNPEQLRRFLRNPGIGLACSAIDHILGNGQSPEATQQRAAGAVTLWTHALLGTVHRRTERSTQDYLGIVRWLRRLGQHYAQHQGGATLRDRIEDAIQYTRKWGVFGGTVAARQSALSALVPLREVTDRGLDHLVYESLVFRRRLDVELAVEPGEHSLTTPWALQALRMPGPAGADYVAISRRDDGTVGQLLRAPPVEPAEALGAHRPAVQWVHPTRLDGEPRRGPEYARRILLGLCGEGHSVHPYILSVSAPDEGAGAMAEEAIELRFLDDDPERRRGTLSVADLVAAASEAPPGSREKPESVFSLLALDGGVIVVGLQGTAGRVRIGLLRVGPDGALEALRRAIPDPFPAAYPELKTFQANPVWSLAARQGADGDAILFLGCGDGGVLRVDVHRRTDGTIELSKLVVVGRLAAPVRALACRAREDGSPVRVFAGGADGTLVAFQLLPPSRAEQAGLQKSETGTETWTTLWATQEQSRVATLHAFEAALPGEDDGHLVLALTQEGIGALFSDRAAVPARDADERELRRIAVPGERLGRFAVGSTVHGSHLWEVRRPGDHLERPLAQLAVATAAGSLRLLTLHHPRSTKDRHDRYEELLGRWLLQLRGTASEKGIQGHLLRQPESTQVIAAELPAVLVRWILSSRRDGEEAVAWEERSRQGGLGPGPNRQWLPRHLRPLADLDAAWSCGVSLRGKLTAALLAAHGVQDRLLFKEILEATLSRANHQLFAEAEGGSEPAFAARFVELLADLEQLRLAWPGTAGNVDTKMRITVAKSLLDGDTLWRLSRVHPPASAPGATGGTDDFRGPLSQAMRARVELVHRFLGKGDLLLALETLRAANTALLRLCRRLRRPKGKVWSEDDADGQLRWDSVSGFFEALGDFAARAAHPKGSLGEVAAHEVCRAYALGMLACPAAAARLAFWVTEADLPPGTGERVLLQMGLLAELLGMEMPDPHRELVRVAFGLGNGERDHQRALFYPERPDKRVVSDEAIGETSAGTIRDRQPLDAIVLWLHELARQLTDDAGGVDVRRALHLKEALAGVSPQFRHSRDFWARALDDLERSTGEFRDLPPPGVGATDERQPPPVRPEVVLFSAWLAAWCKRQRDELRARRRRYRMFEPVGALYDEALALVERAAERFRHGAGVQKSIVLGVLGHGLLEMLDEHLLEMWEVAQALEPLRTWQRDAWEAGPGSPLTGNVQAADTSTAGRFAHYLLRRAANAEVIPKNLRSLQGLLSSSSRRLPAPSRSRSLGDLLREVARREKWVLSLSVERFDATALDGRAYHFLHLTLSELAQNDRCYGVRGQPESSEYRQEPGGPWRPTVTAGDGQEIVLDFRYPADDHPTVSAALRESLNLQSMVSPRDDPRFPSHGTGLYLANLAAAATGWKLWLKPEDYATEGRLRFRLLHKGASAADQRHWARGAGG